MEPVRTVLLDIDGTLIYSNDEHARAFVLAAEELGLASPGVEGVRRLVGMGGDKLIPLAFGFDSEGPDGTRLREHKDRIFRDQMLPGLQPTPGARELLERLRADGLRLIAATSASSDDLELLLDRAGVADLIDERTSASDVEESKPAPDLVRAALDLGGVGPGQAIMIGDTPYDVEAASRAGVRLVAVRTGGWTAEELSGAAAVYDHPAAILADYPAVLSC